MVGRAGTALRDVRAHQPVKGLASCAAAKPASPAHSAELWNRSTKLCWSAARSEEWDRSCAAQGRTLLAARRCDAATSAFLVLFTVHRRSYSSYAPFQPCRARITLTNRSPGPCRRSRHVRAKASTRPRAHYRCELSSDARACLVACSMDWCGRVARQKRPLAAEGVLRRAGRAVSCLGRQPTSTHAQSCPALLRRQQFATLALEWTPWPLGPVRAPSEALRP